MAVTRRDVLRQGGLASLAALLPMLQAAGASADAVAGGLVTSWDDADATTLAQWIARGDVTAQEVLDETVRRLERINPILNVLAQDHIELAQAALSNGLPTGPFSGVPFLLKDLGISLGGTVTSAGSALNANQVATTDSEIVRRFKAAGLLIFGKTNTPEFGLALTTEGAHLGDCLTLGISRTVPVGRAGVQPRWWRPVSCPWPTRLTEADRYVFQPITAAFLA